MTTFTINHNTNTIEMSKSFAKDASVFGSEAYRNLIAARNDFPSYKVIIKKTVKSGNTFKGMDYDFMKDYIARHEADDVRASELQKLIDSKLQYGEIKQWFINQYPIFKECTTRAQWVLAA